MFSFLPRTDSQQKYSLVIGVLTKGDCVASGTMQMYSVEYRTTKILEGQVGTFAEIVLDGNKVNEICLDNKNMLSDISIM